MANKSQSATAIDLHDPLAVAERALIAAEDLPLGAPTTDAFAAAQAAIDRLVTAARAILLPPELQPVSAATLADFKLAIEGVGAHEMTATLVALHERSLDHYDELAGVVRSMRAVHRVARSALLMSQGEPGSDQRACAEFASVIAAQVVERDGHALAPAARVLVRDVPRLTARLVAVESTHKAHAIAEAERARVEAEREEAARLDQERAEERREWSKVLRAESADPEATRRRTGLIEFFQQYPAHVFRINGQPKSGQDCTNDLRAGAEIFHYFNGQTSGERRRPVAAR